MPPSSTTGIDSGSAPRNRIVGHSRPRHRGVARHVARVAMKCTATIISSAISSPGTTPPRNSAPTEAPETRRVDHHRDRRRDDRPDASALATTTAPAKPRVYSGFFSICLIVTRPGPAASAMALPLMPEKITLTQDVDLRQPAAQAADEDAAEVEQALADRAGVHHVGREDEQRHRQQHVAVVQAVAAPARRPGPGPAP